MLKKFMVLFVPLFLAVGCGDDDDVIDFNDINDIGVEQSIVDLAAEDPRFSILVDALERAGLVATLEGEGPFTVFAPTDDAFIEAGIDLDEVPADELENILLYHVVDAQLEADQLETGAREAVQEDYLVIRAENDSVTVNNANVVEADLIADNGVIHAIDAVLLPPTRNVVDELREREEFSELMGALEATGLDETLENNGPFTIFAPTNEAFDAVQETVAGLSEEELRDVLLYHVLGQRVFSTQLTDGDVETLLEDAEVTINVQELTVNDAGILVDDVDIQGTNGVIHAIDSVLIPE